MNTRETKEVYSRRSIATLLALTAALLWIVPVVRGAEPTNASSYRFVPVANDGDIGLFEPYDVNKRGDALYFGNIFGNFGVLLPGLVYVRTQNRIRIVNTPSLDGSGWQHINKLGYIPINDNGDVAFGTYESQNEIPWASSGRLFRYSSAKQKLTDITPMQAPGGGALVGLYVNTSLNNKGDIVFPGIVEGYDIDRRAAPGCSLSECGYGDLGVGVFRIDQFNKRHKVVKPGDKAPVGRVFDWAGDPWINDHGDVAFRAHLRGDKCDDSQGRQIFCSETGVYLRTGLITRSIAYPGDPAPGGGIYKSAYGPIVSNSGQVVYIGHRIASDRSESLGVFLYSGGVARAVALAGDNMPGGGKLASVSGRRGDYDINNLGQISFSASLNEDRNHDGDPDSALYVFTPDAAASQSGRRVKGTTKLVIRTGTYISGFGTVMWLGYPCCSPSPSGGMINDSAKMLVYVSTDRWSGLLWAVPQT